MVKTIVIGAGPAGLGVALGHGDGCTVLEQCPTEGGLSCSLTIDGAVFDYGGHSFHTPHPDVRDLVFNAVEMFEQERKAFCCVRGDLIPYPFQKSFRQLKHPEIVEECAQGLEQINGANGAANFEDFISHRFGPGISKHFMLPYNRKLWGRDLKRLAADWTGERVAAPEGQKETFDTQGGQRKPLQSGTKVAYPAQGGFGEIFLALGKRVGDLRLGQQVVSIDVAGKTITTQQGETLQWDRLVSTLPLPILIQMLSQVPANVQQRMPELDVLSLKLGLVVIGHPVDTEVQRIYSAESEIPAHKIAVNHNSSDSLRALPHHGIMMEISTGPAKELPQRDLKQWIVDSLITTGLIKDAGEVRHVEVRDIKYGYPVPTANRDEIVQNAKSFLESEGIYTLGRFGEWAYINSDEALSRGLLLGRQLAGTTA